MLPFLSDICLIECFCRSRFCRGRLLSVLPFTSVVRAGGSDCIVGIEALKKKSSPHEKKVRPVSPTGYGSHGEG